MTAKKEQDPDEHKKSAVAFPVTDNEALAKKWNAMTAWLGSSFMSPAYAALMPHLQLHHSNSADDNACDPFKVLDVAVGDGLNSVRMIKELLLTKADGTAGFEYHGVDIAEQMIKLCRQRIKQDVLIQTILKNPNQDPKYKIALQVANGEDLSVFADASFDRYIASLCLMITGDAAAMIKESFRLLKANGISAWSIWGYQEKGVFFESLPKVLAPIQKKLQLGMDAKPATAAAPRSNYYLAQNMEQTVQLFKSVGYRTVFYWDANVALPVSSGKQWFDFMVVSPSI